MQFRSVSKREAPVRFQIIGTVSFPNKAKGTLRLCEAYPGIATTKSSTSVVSAMPILGLEFGSHFTSDAEPFGINAFEL
jgi:hypothetical protein